MSNLGTYQLMTTLAKKVGGPKKLLLIVAATGWIVLRSGEASAKAIVSKFRNTPHTSSDYQHFGETFAVTATTELVEGLILNEGSTFHVLERDQDSVLIAVSDDKNNPYFVSAEKLSKISNYSLGAEAPREDDTAVDDIHS
jgi:hypothetical protein